MPWQQFLIREATKTIPLTHAVPEMLELVQPRHNQAFLMPTNPRGKLDVPVVVALNQASFAHFPELCAHISLQTHGTSGIPVTGPPVRLCGPPLRRPVLKITLQYGAHSYFCSRASGGEAMVRVRLYFFKQLSPVEVPTEHTLAVRRGRIIKVFPLADGTCPLRRSNHAELRTQLEQGSAVKCNLPFFGSYERVFSLLPKISANGGIQSRDLGCLRSCRFDSVCWDKQSSSFALVWGARLFGKRAGWAKNSDIWSLPTPTLGSTCVHSIGFTRPSWLVASARPEFWLLL